MATKKFPSEMSDRGTVLLADKILIYNSTTGASDEYTTIDKILDATSLKGQIKFPATQVPSSNANTLDDYEEGVWTPALHFSTSDTGLTYNAATEGRYTKIGRVVFVDGVIILTAIGSASGDCVISGLPFTIYSYCAPSMRISDISFANQFQASGNLVTTTIDLLEITEAGSLTSLTHANFSNSSSIRFSMSYSVQ